MLPNVQYAFAHLAGIWHHYAEIILRANTRRHPAIAVGLNRDALAPIHRNRLSGRIR